MDLSAETSGDISIVNMPGEYLDASTVKEFKADIAAFIEGDAKKIVFDMSSLQFIDSSGLGAILSCLRKLNGSGGELKLCGMSKPVRALFELVRMHRIMDIYDARDDAISAYK